MTKTAIPNCYDEVPSTSTARAKGTRPLDMICEDGEQSLFKPRKPDPSALPDHYLFPPQGELSKESQRLNARQASGKQYRGYDSCNLRLACGGGTPQIPPASKILTQLGDSACLKVDSIPPQKKSLFVRLKSRWLQSSNCPRSHEASEFRSLNSSSTPPSALEISSARQKLRNTIFFKQRSACDTPSISKAPRKMPQPCSSGSTFVSTESHEGSSRREAKEHQVDDVLRLADRAFCLSSQLSSCVDVGKD